MEMEYWNVGVMGRENVQCGHVPPDPASAGLRRGEAGCGCLESPGQGPDTRCRGCRGRSPRSVGKDAIAFSRFRPVSSGLQLLVKRRSFHLNPRLPAFVRVIF